MTSPNIITVDWEDWFHICEVDHILPRHKWDSYDSILPEATEKLLDFFKYHKITATFFILGYAAKKRPELVRAIAGAGHEIAYHSFEHKLIYEQEPDDFRRDIVYGKQMLAEISGQEVAGFRAPQWSLNKRCPWGLEILAEVGYLYDSSHAPLPVIGDPAYPEIPHEINTIGADLQEIPPLVLNICGLKVPAGGGWGLKTWPLAFIADKMNRLNAAGFPATFFVHPVDFVDYTPPVSLPLLKRAVVGYGLRNVADTLEKLLQRTTFISIRQYLQNMP
jgi:polysaccharide deacetylase family protein (PEP-CTERM system associated)